MPGTIEGGRKARDTNLRKDPDFYKKIGAIGGKIGRTGGFHVDDRSVFDKLMGRPSRAQIAGAKGGKISRRGKANG